MYPPAIFCVAEEHATLLNLETHLSQALPDYSLEKVTSAVEALQRLEDQILAGIEVPLVIADQNLSEMTGDALLTELQARHPQILKILLVDSVFLEMPDAELSTILSRTNLYRFLPKPWNPFDLKLTVTEALRCYSQKQQTIQQQARLEQARRQSEAQNRAILSALPDIVTVINGDGRYLSFSYNQFAGDIIPMGGGYLEGLHVTDVLPPEAARTILAAIERTLQSGEIHTHEQQIEFGDRIQYEEVRIVPYQSDRVLCMVRNISDRKQTERALQESQQRLALALDSAKAGIWTWDMGTNQTYWSDENFRLLGYEPGSCESTYDNWLRAVHPDDGEQVNTCVTRVIENREDLNLEYRVLLPDGTTRWLHDIGRLIYDAHHQPIGMTGIQVDITHRKQVETAFRESQQLIQQIADCSPNVIYIYDFQQQRNVYVNQEVVAFLGYTAEEVAARVDQSIATLMHPDDLNAAMQYFQQFSMLPDGAIAEFEYRMQHKNGEWRWFVSRDTVFKRDADGNVIQILGNAQDISDRKQAEEQLRTSLREKEALLAEIHHRVKNNLQIISSLLNLQAYKIDDPQIQKALEDSWTRIDSMALVHETLYRSQDFSSINFACYLENLTQNLFCTYNIRTDRIRLTIEADRKITLNLDQAIPCGLIVNELLTNALKHAFQLAPDQMEAGHLFVHLTQDPGHPISLSVGNSGDTLPPDFDPYQTRSMGLKLVTSLVSQLDGSLTVLRSEQPEGGVATIFQVTFDPTLSADE